MRIGLVLSASPGYSETFFRTKIIGLQQAGHSVILFCQTASPAFDLCPVHLFPNTKGSKIGLLFRVLLTYIGLLPYISRIWRFYTLQASGPNFFQFLKQVYLQAPLFKQSLDWLHFGFGTLALGRETIPKVLGAQMAVSFRGFDIGVYPLKHPKCYTKLWNHVDKIHVISDDIEALLYQHGYKDQAQVVKITPAIDPHFFHKSVPKVSDTSTLEFLTVARLHWKKGLDYTLQALYMLKELGYDFKYTLIGDGPEAEHLQFLVHQYGLTDVVVFTGALDPQTVKTHYERSDIYIQYSVQEGFCNAVLEAQAMGLLCVVSDAEGLSENVLHEQTGWVVRKRNVKALVDCLQYVMKLDDKRKKVIHKQAQERVLHIFNVTNQIQAFLDFYKLPNNKRF